VNLAVADLDRRLVKAASTGRQLIGLKRSSPC
jgi:hypothetical protein